MTRHVDVVKNEWLAGVQYPVARVLVEHGHLVIDAEEPERWRESLVRAVDSLDPDAEPEKFLAALEQQLHGSYLFATAPHDESECPFHNRGLLHLQPTESPQSVPA